MFYLVMLFIFSLAAKGVIRDYLYFEKFMREKPYKVLDDEFLDPILETKIRKNVPVYKREGNIIRAPFQTNITSSYTRTLNNVINLQERKRG